MYEDVYAMVYVYRSEDNPGSRFSPFTFTWALVTELSVSGFGSQHFHPLSQLRWHNLNHFWGFWLSVIFIFS